MKVKNKTIITKDEILRKLEENSDILEKYKVKRIGLFGSYVRSEQKNTSDIDLLVEFDLTAFDKDYKGYFDCYMELLFFLKEIFGRKVELLTIESISPYIRPYILKEVMYLEKT